MARGQITKGAALSYATVAFNALAGLVYTPWMVASIGAGDYGLYTLAISVINFFLLDFGLGEAVARFMSKYYAQGREDLANQFLGFAYKVYLVVTACIFVILLVIFVFIGRIYANLPPSQLSTFKILYAIAAISSVVTFPFVSFKGVLTANEQFVALNLCALLQKVFTVALIVVALLFGFGVYALVAVNAAVGLAFVIIRYLIIRRNTDVKPVFVKAEPGMMREVLGFSFWSMVVQVCQRLIFTVMPTVLAIVSNTWEIALFGLASSLEGYAWSVANALNSMFMPKVARLLADGSSAELQKLAERIGRIQLLIIGGIVIAFAAIGGRFVDCWMGEGYEALWLCALLLMIPLVADLPLMIASTAVIAAGEVKARGQVFIVMAAANIILGFLLSMRLGALGACAAICIAYLLRTAGMCVIYRRRLALKLKEFFVHVFARWLLVAIVALIVAGVLSALVPVGGWPGFCLMAVIFFVLYAALCWLFALNRDEKSRAASFARRL